MTVESVELIVERFLERKRAIGRGYVSEHYELRLLVRFAAERGISSLDELTPALLDEFLGSRPRSRPPQLQPSARCRRLPAGLGRQPVALGSLAVESPPAAGDLEQHPVSV
jgi:hypothetical protein